MGRLILLIHTESKVRCDQVQPCRKCNVAHLECTYNDRVKRKTVPRINRPPLPPSIGSYQSPSSREDASSISGRLPGEGEVSPTAASNQNLDPRLGRPSAGRFDSIHSIAPGLLSQLEVYPMPPRISSRLLSLHVKLFLRFMYPLWPVLRPKDLVDTCKDVESLSPKRYALLLSVCAATNVQLKLSAMHMLSDLPDDTVSELYTLYTQDYLLNEAVKSRNQINIAEEPDIDALLTSTFLFSCYANLERNNEAWFYLSQAVSFVISLQLHDEASYASYGIAEAEIRSRIFWMVFILERL